MLLLLLLLLERTLWSEAEQLRQSLRLLQVRQSKGQGVQIVSEESLNLLSPHSARH